MKTAGTHHFIDRTYRESGQFQWVRETFTNAIEADATRVEFGIEWQAVESLGVYRRVIADNGQGMTADELVEFFNTFGGGGKPIGGVHENFGVGAKTSLLPWNKYGLVVISWVDGDPAMIWVRHDPKSEEYGLQVFEAFDPDTDDMSLEEVVFPFDDPDHGCDWELVKPDWIQEHGTVVVLLGDDPTAHTVLGDPNREEADIKGISRYLNRRIWTVPDDVDVLVDELRTNDRANWPRSEEEAHGAPPDKGYDRRSNLRRIEGAEYFIEYPAKGFKKGALEASGVVGLEDGTDVAWYLWSGDRPAVQSYAAIGGYIGALYQNELYDITAHAATYRSFGVSEGDVRRRLWLIVMPARLDDDRTQGVYPRTDRNSLLLKGGPSAGEPLPINDWGNEFSDLLPEPILAAIRSARGGAHGSITDPTWRDRLAERFGKLWRIPKLRRKKGGPVSMDPDQEGTDPRPVRKPSRRRGMKGSGGGGGTKGASNTGSAGSKEEGRKSKVSGGIPEFLWRPATDFESLGYLGAWQPNDPDYPQGVVLLNVEHPVIEGEIERWQSMYADHHADGVREEVLRAYGEIAVSKVAHSEFLKAHLASGKVDEELRSPGALTMALLGLLAEEAVISTRVGGKFGRRRTA